MTGIIVVDIIYVISIHKNYRKSAEGLECLSGMGVDRGSGLNFLLRRRHNIILTPAGVYIDAGRQ